MALFDFDGNEWVHEFMIPYAELGLEQWKSSDAELTGRAFECLDGYIAMYPSDVKETVYGPTGTREPLLIPMPKPKKQIEQAFFLPHMDSSGVSSPMVSFEMFLIVKEKLCLAFRWEPADTETTHGYGHVQMCTDLIKRALKPSTIPDWLPDSYPAIPILTSEPFGIFLAMITSIHGLDGGILELLGHVLKNEPGLKEKYEKYIMDHFRNK